MAQTCQSCRSRIVRNANTNTVAATHLKANRGSIEDLREQLSRQLIDLLAQLNRPNSAERLVIALNPQAAPTPVLVDVIDQVIVACGRAGVLPMVIGQNVPNSSAQPEQD